MEEKIRLPDVSLVMPTMGRSHHVSATIESLLNQTFDDFELLVRDDGDGTDGKQEAVTKFGDPRIKYFRNPARRAIPGNTNDGLKESCGRFIGVVHDHDLFEPSYLGELVDSLNSHPKANYVHCGIGVIDQSGQNVKTLVGDFQEFTEGRQWLRFMLSSLACPVCAINLVRREAYEKHGFYDPEFGFVADIDMWMKLTETGGVAYVAEPLILVREREDDHFATADADAIIRTVGRIHRKHIPNVYEGMTALPRLAALKFRIAKRLGLLTAARMKRLLLSAR